MAIPFIGPLISAGASLLGGLFNNSARADDRAMQKEAAQNQVQWRVADAAKAGIHPLAALGMSPVSMSPVSVGDPGGFIGDIGQDIERAVTAGSTTTQRAAQVSLDMAEAQLEGARIDNDIKRAELASRIRRNLTGANVGPVIPAVGSNTARGADIGGQTFPIPGGIDVTTSKTATAEEIERQYGDIGQNIYGIGRMIWDASRMVKDDKSIKKADDFLSYALRELFGINPAF